LMTMIAYAFLQHRRLTKVGREKKNQRPATSTDLASRPARHRQADHPIKSSALPHCRTRIGDEKQRS
jgi:hypothetical protein